MPPVLPNGASVGQSRAVFVDNDWVLRGNRGQFLSQLFFVFLDDRRDETRIEEFAGGRLVVAAVGFIDESSHAVAAPTNDEFRVVMNDGKIALLALTKLFILGEQLGRSFLNAVFQFLVRSRRTSSARWRVVTSLPMPSLAMTFPSASRNGTSRNSRMRISPFAWGIGT